MFGLLLNFAAAADETLAVIDQWMNSFFLIKDQLFSFGNLLTSCLSCRVLRSACNQITFTVHTQETGKKHWENNHL